MEHSYLFRQCIWQIQWLYDSNASHNRGRNGHISVSTNLSFLNSFLVFPLENTQWSGSKTRCQAIWSSGCIYNMQSRIPHPNLSVSSGLGPLLRSSNGSGPTPSTLWTENMWGSVSMRSSQQQNILNTYSMWTGNVRGAQSVRSNWQPSIQWASRLCKWAKNVNHGQHEIKPAGKGFKGRTDCERPNM